ncbi:protein NipSnap [Parasteatoda tepidariorum]|uniref:protein NipSnap n=1 Tax=Parasteatoda tepidariorum TaxID=114398 RepID=UPI00077F96D4|nr:protein NipSnap [Parasteatoda tepidariorum]
MSLMRTVSSAGNKTSTVLNFLRLVSSSAVIRANAGGEGWLSKLLHVRKIDPGKDSHSKLLSDTERVYELQIHDVKPECIDPYLKDYENLRNKLQDVSKSSELVGSWRVEIGNQDQFVHIWRYNKGYKNANEVLTLYHEDQELHSLTKSLVKNVICRTNQYMLPFSYWGDPEPQTRNSMYEIRSYVLKPGTMIEWGNNWARGITYRKSSAVAGFFSQIGQLYMVHHIWSYKDLMSRKEFREAAWRKPGWDECVAYTVPLIREMKSRWLRPTSFSPIK